MKTIAFASDAKVLAGGIPQSQHLPLQEKQVDRFGAS